MSNASDYFSIDDAILENDFAKNGDFDIWQEQISLLLPDANRNYAADFWASQRDTAATTVTRQSFTLGQTDIPDAPTFYLNVNKAGIDVLATDTVVNIIEDVRVLNGERVAATIWLKANSAKTFTAELRQHFGSGGSATVVGLTTTFDVNTFWQQFVLTGDLPSISGKTIGTGDHLEFALVEDAGFSVFSLDVAQFRLGQGKVPIGFVYKTLREKLHEAQREYVKSYPTGSFAGAIINAGATAFEAAGAQNIHTVFFPSDMRVAPTMAYYDPFNGTPGQAHHVTSAVAPTPLAQTYAAERSVSTIATGATATNNYYYHWIADSRIPI